MESEPRCHGFESREHHRKEGGSDAAPCDRSKTRLAIVEATLNAIKDVVKPFLTPIGFRRNCGIRPNRTFSLQAAANKFYKGS